MLFSVVLAAFIIVRWPEVIFSFYPTLSCPEEGNSNTPRILQRQKLVTHSKEAIMNLEKEREVVCLTARPRLGRKKTLFEGEKKDNLNKSHSNPYLTESRQLCQKKTVRDCFSGS